MRDPQVALEIILLSLYSLILFNSKIILFFHETQILCVIRSVGGSVAAPKRKKSDTLARIGFSFKKGGDLLSHFYAVPSALTGLTSLFGMGRGGALSL